MKNPICSSEDNESENKNAKRGAKFGSQVGAAAGARVGPFVTGLSSGLGGAVGYLVGSVVDDVADTAKPMTDGGQQQSDDYPREETHAGDEVDIPVQIETMESADHKDQ